MLSRLLLTSISALMIASPTLAAPKGGFSPRFMLRDYFMASQMMGRCPAIAQDKVLEGKLKLLDTFGDQVKAALIARTQALRTDLTADVATKEVEDWMSNQIFELTHVQTADDFCSKSTAAEIAVAIELLSHPSIEGSLKNYAEKKVTGIAKVPFKNNEALSSFAHPEFQVIALGVLTDNHFDAGCEGFKVENVAMKGHAAAGKGDPAPFEVAAMRVTELWTASCGGTSKTFAVEFDRSAEESLGRSIIVEK